MEFSALRVVPLMRSSIVLARVSPNQGDSTPLKPCLTHIAMAVRNLDASIGFYSRYCGFKVVHDRGENARRVVWLAPKESPKSIIIGHDAG